MCWSRFYLADFHHFEYFWNHSPPSSSLSFSSPEKRVKMFIFRQYRQFNFVKTAFCRAFCPYSSLFFNALNIYSAFFSIPHENQIPKKWFKAASRIIHYLFTIETLHSQSTHTKTQDIFFFIFKLSCSLRGRFSILIFARRKTNKTK